MKIQYRLHCFFGSFSSIMSKIMNQIKQLQARRSTTRNLDRKKVSDKPIMEPGVTCWRVAKAGRAAFLIDAASYFEALVSTIRQARSHVYIASWDIDSRTRLLRRNGSEGGTNNLGKFLKATVHKNPQLEIYILSWDFAVIYVLEREWLPIFGRSWKAHRRIHFRKDSEHPLGACQHQKFVVVDDTVAFCGGIDLTRNRWDTPEHRRFDSRRIDPDRKAYAPFHDVQMAVDGNAASLLGDLFRNRWLRASGQRLAASGNRGAIPWPRAVEPDFSNVPVGVARTLPPYKDQEEVREVEALYRAAAASARRYIYIESQYLTSAAVVNALAESLKKPSGPEIVLVLPKESSGWLEQSTMDSLRMRMLEHLKTMDHSGRMRTFYPVSDGQDVYVHSKVLVVDDRLVRIGSSNLSNRSMAFDSECDLVIEATNETVSEGIARFRNRLLAEHLGSNPEAVSKRILESGSLIRTIEELSGSSRTLELLDCAQKPWLDGVSLVQDPGLLDPERPVELDRMLDHFTQDGRSKYKLLKPALFFTLLLGLSAAWRWTPLSEWISIESLTSWAESIKGTPFMPLVVIGVYVAGGVFMLPVTLLVTTTAIVFNPLLSFIYALGGCLASALICYGIGAKLGKETVGKFAGSRLHRLNRWLSNPGIVSIAIARNVPVVPFSILNLLAGAWQIRLKDYLLGTAIGMAPGILVITVFTDRLIAAVKKPQLGNIAVIAGIAVGLAIMMWWFKKRLFTSGGNRMEKAIGKPEG